MVTYNNVPELGQVIRAINDNIITNLIVVDNSLGNRIGKLVSSIKNENIVVIYNNENRGISFALNQAFLVADDLEVNACFLLDDDADVSEDYFSSLLTIYNELSEKLSNIGAVCPIVTNRKNQLGRRIKKKETMSNIASAITSGTLINLYAAKAVNGYDEKFFLEFADIDFFHRLVDAGYVIYRYNKIMVVQDFGVTISSRGFWTNVLRTAYILKYIVYVWMNLGNDLFLEIGIYSPERELVIAKLSREIRVKAGHGFFQRGLYTVSDLLFIYLKFIATKNSEYLKATKEVINWKF